MMRDRCKKSRKGAKEVTEGTKDDNKEKEGMVVVEEGVRRKRSIQKKYRIAKKL